MSSESSPAGPPAVPCVQVIGVTGIPEIEAGDRLGKTIASAAEKQATPVQTGDVLVVTQKIVSKAESRTVDLRDIEPSVFARQLAKEAERDARLVELVLRESQSIVRMDVSRGILITETRHGFVCANAGIDASNVPGDTKVCLLPEDPDHSAALIREDVLRETAGADVAVVVSDTFGRAWREGHANIAIGVAGIRALRDYRGTPDDYGLVLKTTNMAIADELASAAELVTGKTARVPVAIVRGYSYSKGPDGAGTLLRDRANDLFR